MIFRINAEIGKKTSVVLTVLPFVLLVVGYVAVAHVRHLNNPNDKIVPTPSELAEGFKNTAFQPDRRGDFRLWKDTWASAKRFFIGVALLFIGMLLGLHMGMMPFFEKTFYRFMVFFDKIPALALLPILFIVFGLGETAKIALIVIGVLPTITLDTYLRAKALPREQVIKAFTLGASDQEVLYRVVLRQILPKVLDTIRLNFKAVMLFLIAGESLAATAGLGYRIFVVRRYMAMNIIIPYVIWMGLLLFLADVTVRLWIEKRYPWLDSE